MAQKETLEKFVKNLHKFPALIKAVVLNEWNKNTLVAMGKAQFYAPLDIGTLQGSARKVIAILTRKGIKSAFRFTVPYAKKLEDGFGFIRTKRGIKRVEFDIKTDKNPNAQSGYAARGVAESEPLFMKDLNKAISEAFQKI
jgi:hypothetical protein